MGSFKDISGNRYGRLVVIKRDTSIKSKNPKWICKCDCGKNISVSSCSLKSGKTKSCGCLKKEGKKGVNKTHGMSKTHIYQEWLSMRKRCKESSPDAKTYYERGIKVCDEWQTSFEAFYNWSIQNNYNESLSLDRIDNDLGYFPDNCRWIDIKLQQGNKSNTIKVVYNGKTYCLRTLCNEIGFCYKTAHSRYTKMKKQNRSIDMDVLFAPIRCHNS